MHVERALVNKTHRQANECGLQGQNSWQIRPFTRRANSPFGVEAAAAAEEAAATAETHIPCHGSSIREFGSIELRGSTKCKSVKMKNEKPERQHKRWEVVKLRR